MTATLIQSLAGIVVFIAIAWVFSEDRKAVRLNLIFPALGAQVMLALVLLHLPIARSMVEQLGLMVGVLQGATREGTSFVFGFIGGGLTPYDVTDPTASFSLAFQALPMVLVLAALTALFWHWGVLKLLVRGFAFALRRVLGLGGAVGVAAAANVFMGMIEAPLLIRPYLRKVSRGELAMVMSTGLATVSGSLLAMYAAFLAVNIPTALGHLLIASVTAVPGAILLSRLLVPPHGTTPATDVDPSFTYSGTLDAISRGTQDGVQVLINVIAMLIVVVAIVALINSALGLLPPVWGDPLTLQRLLGWVFAPFAWLIGIPAEYAPAAGQLLGLKTMLNEIFAFVQLGSLSEEDLPARAQVVMVYALCGFANLSSLGILIGGLAALVPERRAEIIGLAPRCLIAGVLAGCLTAAIANIVLPDAAL